ncbi:hypothetical protein AWB81_07174 [Caballeronia arationis]|uniref:hypothetical protein n=1 Tax=Caballeronia arationis TaxID=1777142 RepID=UPI00074B9EBF|nr:hypothetical protein [Caballeronia arationis]SAL05469.1 hypothetical protein AWB81_07174 [Caballeronia arationis]
MQAEVKPMRERGGALDHVDVQKAPGIYGDLLVVQEKSSALNRYSNIARFQITAVSEPQPIPPLHDAVLSWMGPNGFVLTGIEFADGIAYAQSWWCRPA